MPRRRDEVARRLLAHRHPAPLAETQIPAQRHGVGVALFGPQWCRRQGGWPVGKQQRQIGFRVGIAHLWAGNYP